MRDEQTTWQHDDPRRLVTWTPAHPPRAVDVIVDLKLFGCGGRVQRAGLKVFGAGEPGIDLHHAVNRHPALPHHLEHPERGGDCVGDAPVNRAPLDPASANVYTPPVALIGPDSTNQETPRLPIRFGGTSGQGEAT